MADLSITASQVQFVTGTKETLTAGTSASPGELIRIDSNDANQLKLGQANSAANASVYGIVLNPASDEQPCTVQKTGKVTIGAGASIVAGQTYVCSTTAGKIALRTDLSSGSFVTSIGIGTTDNALLLNIYASGTATT